MVLIVKGDRTFDEILGDVTKAGEKTVQAEPSFARFGSEGYVSGGRTRFSLHTFITPNHHAIAARWSFADNFYVDSDYSSAARTLAQPESVPTSGAETEPIYREAGKSEIVAGRFHAGSGDTLVTSNSTTSTFAFSMALTARCPTNRVLRASSTRSATTTFEPGKPLPRFLEVHLPNDTAAVPHPDDGYDYEASYVADNDYALGRVLEFLSHSPWWKEMAVFITESGAEYGADHVDSHRIKLLLGAGPWFRTDYVSHNNSSFPALLATFYKLLGLPPLNLYDATAGDLLDMFGNVADLTPYEVKAEDSRLFDPQRVK